MNKINTITYLGLFVNALILVYIGCLETYEFLFIPAVIAFLLCIIGLVLLIIDKIKAGSILFFIGSIFFVPLGMIAAMGIGKTISDLKERKFNKEFYGDSN